MDNKKYLNFIELLEQYPYPISLYHNPPDLTISIKEFENLARKRIEILNCISNCVNKKHQNPIYDIETHDIIDKNLPLDYNKKGKNIIDYEEEEEEEEEEEDIEYVNLKTIRLRQNDHISHYILLLLCCHDYNIKNWLIKNELYLFKIRLKEIKTEKKLEFIRNLKTLKKYKSLITDLRRANPKEYAMYSGYYKYSKFLYKVPFEKVTDLIYNRKVIVKNGYAFIHPDDTDYVLYYYFKKTMKNNLDNIEKASNFLMDEFEYVFTLLDKLKDECQYNTEYWKNNLLKILFSYKDIKSISKYFPPCMNYLYMKLKENRHLKYNGRMQFGLFLKCGVGLKLNDSLIFWEKAFQPKIDSFQFKKEYAYNIRHNYGKEGSCIDYQSFNCEQIQNYSEPHGIGQYHGCPFKHFSNENLIQYLNRYIGMYCNNDNSITSFNSSNYSSISTDFSNDSIYFGSPPVAFSNPTIETPIIAITNLVNKEKYNHACSYLFEYIHLISGNKHKRRKINEISNKNNDIFNDIVVDIENLKIIDNPDKFFQLNFKYFF